MKNRRYINWVRSLPCAVCGHPESQAHHIIGTGHGTMGGKASDFYAIPLCFHHHTGDQGIHQVGAKTWEREFGPQWEMVGKTLGRAVFDGVLKL